MSSDKTVDRCYRRMKTDLTNSGTGLLICGLGMFAAVILFIKKYGVGIIPGLLIGGIIGVALALHFRGNPARFGYHFSQLPKALSPYEQDLQMRIDKLRKPWFVLVVTVPYFLWLLSYLLAYEHSRPPSDLGTQATSGIFSTLMMSSFAWSAQYLQVLLSLDRSAVKGPINHKGGTVRAKNHALDE